MDDHFSYIRDKEVPDPVFTYHTTRTEGSGKITGVIDHSKENIGTRNQGYLVPGTMLPMDKVGQYTL